VSDLIYDDATADLVDRSICMFVVGVYVMEQKPKRMEGEGEPLPRDILRFRKLHSNGRAVIRKDATETLGFISTLELIAKPATEPR